MPSTPHRTAGLVLAVGTIAIAIVVTQWPFEYRLTWFAVDQRWHRIDWSWFPRTPRGAIRIDRDLWLNLLMLVPLGFGLGLWRPTTGLRLVALALVVGALTSSVLELAQLATRERYATFADVWRNTLGCVVGAALALAVRGANNALSRAWRRALAR